MILTNHIKSKRVDFPGGYFDKGGVHWLLRDGLGSVGMTVDNAGKVEQHVQYYPCFLYTSPSPRDRTITRMPSSALENKRYGLY